MGNLERTATRDAVAQMLADAGINRETLPALVREIITERVDKALNRALHEGVNLDRVVEEITRKRLDLSVYEGIKRIMGSVNVSISHDDRKLDGSRVE
jgi:hypothetical protein